MAPLSTDNDIREFSTMWGHVRYTGSYRVGRLYIAIRSTSSSVISSPVRS